MPIFIYSKNAVVVTRERVARPSQSRRNLPPRPYTQPSLHPLPTRPLPPVLANLSMTTIGHLLRSNVIRHLNIKSGMSPQYLHKRIRVYNELNSHTEEGSYRPPDPPPSVSGTKPRKLSKRAPPRPDRRENLSHHRSGHDDSSDDE